ncbi:MAG: sigma-70 family RNA polymerase sigma factor [Chloroflexi bacterium]|nr:sigma-70 family RNA polymerase sigma factor [Chloroflexota bacterium]MCZ6708082.1 sigma-70 family RNA polymerase sigma factor [Chloroflexota bacterium]
MTVVSLDAKRVELLSTRAAAGDREAFGALYDRYHEELLAYARRRVPSLEDAEDLVEQAFYKALRSIERKSSASAFNVWLFHIAKNLITDFYRTRKQHDPIFEELSTMASAEDQVLRQEMGGQLGQAVAELTERQQAVIHLRFVEGLEYPEIASKLGCGASTVRVTQMRALRSLRTSLREKPLRAS